MTERDHGRRADQAAAGAAPGAGSPGTAGAAGPAGGAAGEHHDDAGWSSLIGDDGWFAREWDRIETEFVDDPRRAVERADDLVGEVIRALTDSFTETRSRLEDQWGKGDEVSTEDLRLTLQRYRAFFNRLLPS